MANAALSFFSASLIEFTPKLFLPKPSILLSKPNSLSSSTLLPPPIPRSLATTHLPSSRTLNRVSCQSASTLPSTTTHYEFLDGPTEVELRLDLGANEVQSYKDIIVDSDDKSLAIRVQHSGSLKTLMETACLYGRIKPAETIWYMDDGQVIVSLKKQDPDLKWPDIVETWESLTVGVMQLLKGTSIYLVGESTEINDIVARELAVGLGYAPLNTKELLETYTKQTLDSWVTKEGPESVATAESAILESLSSYVRAVVATIGGQHGSAAKTDGWRHLYTGFTVWLSQSEATDEDSAKAEARRNVEDGIQGYTNAEVVVKLGGWDPNYAKSVAQASLSALKQLILSDKKLPGKKSLYIRLGCRGDWPNIEPPGGDPSSSTGSDTSSSSSSRSS